MACVRAAASPNEVRTGYGKSVTPPEIRSIIAAATGLSPGATIPARSSCPASPVQAVPKEEMVTVPVHAHDGRRSPTVGEKGSPRNQALVAERSPGE